MSRILWKTVDVVRLALALQEPGRGLCIEEVMERFEVSRRTAERMRATVEQLFTGLHFELGPDRKRYWKLRRGEADGLMLWTLEELVAVEAACRVAREEGAAERARHLAGVAGKIRSQLRPVDPGAVREGRSAPARPCAALDVGEALGG